MSPKQKLTIIFSAPELKESVFIIIGMLLIGFLEVVGVSSIAPFIAVVSDPELIHNNYYLELAYQISGANSNNNFIILLGINVVVILLISNIFQAFMNWKVNRFTQLQTHRSAVRLLKYYLSRDYSFFLGKNTSELSKNILNEVDRAISGTILPIFLVFSKLIIALFLFLLLVYIDSIVAIISITILGGSYWLIYRIVRQRLSDIGIKGTKAQFQKFKTISEAMSGVKDIKLRGSEEEFIGRFFLPSKLHAHYISQKVSIAMLPRYLLEIIAFSGIIGIVIFLILENRSSSQIIPIVSIYAMAGFRLLPALQQIYSGITTIKFNMPAFEILVDEFSQHIDRVKPRLNQESIVFENELRLKDLSFAYSNSENLILNKLNLEIASNSTVGIVGSTGSGKTTLVDLLLGLLTYHSGKITVDGVQIDKNNFLEWRKKIGYVPQSIYLTDDTIKQNIAFSTPQNEIDIRQVKKAAKMASLDGFISTLPEQYNTLVGERGVRLSGGQRQRIGIARALYHNPEILMLDEATSALDGATEDAIMDAIHNLSHKKTIIMIAHRLTTLKEFDVIHIMSHGKIIDSGTYQQLINNNKEFQRMAKIL